jgi:protein-arginine kinase activator protein McsA
MKDEKQIEEMARDIFEPRVTIDGIDIAFAAVHGADRDAENHFMRIARHLYEKCWRKQKEGEFVLQEGYNHLVKCTACGYEYHDFIECMSFCGNCGAKMKGGA